MGDNTETLYRFFDEQDKLLYVGISKNFIARLSQHEADKDWSGDIVSAKIEYYEGEQAARIAESKAISVENPIHNIVRPSMGGTRMVTISINDATNDILDKIKSRRINRSKLICELLALYAANDYRIPAVIIAPKNRLSFKMDEDEKRLPGESEEDYWERLGIL